MTATNFVKILSSAILVLAFLWLPGSAWAQPTSAPTSSAPGESPLQRYEQGKQLLAEQKYKLALTALQPLIITTVQAPLPQTFAASYLWALAAMRSERVAEADALLKKLRTEQRQWAGYADATLLHAQVAEALGDRERARTFLNELPADQLQAEKQALLTRLGFGAAVAPQPLTGPLRVVALLPLNLDAADPRRSAFGQEIYAGLKLAADSLTGLGTAVELRAFDLGNDTVAVKNILGQLDLGAVDLIVGPIYKGPARLVARAAAARQVPVVNPLSEDGSLLATGPTLYLLRPSVQTQARAAARLAAQWEPQNAILLLEDTKDDAAFAAAFRAEYTALGGTIKAEETVSSQTYRTKMTEKIAGLPLDSASLPGVLVVASDEKNCAVQVTGRVAREELQMPVIAPATWLEMPDLSLDQFSKGPFYFLAPAYREIFAPAARRFRRAWQVRYGVPPSDFGRAGFELLYWFGPAVRQYGPAGLATGLGQRGIGPAPLLNAIGYPANARDNQAMTVLRLIDRVVEVVK